MDQFKSVRLLLVAILLVMLSDGVVWAAYIFNVYDNQESGVAIRYPRNWNIQEKIMGTVAMFIAPQDNPTDLYRETNQVVSLL